MISVDEALAAIACHVQPLAAVTLPLAESLGRVLASDITSDIDSPPYDKAMMDGFAVIADDTTDIRTIVGEIMAGDPAPGEVTPGTAIRIMTGAPIPPGTTAVIPVEQTELVGENSVRLLSSLALGKHIMNRGTAMRRGQRVLRSGAVIGSAHIALLAEVGAAQVNVVPPPRVAVLATGNELVPCGQFPAAAQIRNSNGPALRAAVAQAGGIGFELPVARDDLAETCDRIRQGLDSDLLIVTGGVSAGVKDLVPQALAECGVGQIFHKVNLKPGKPLWFGVTPGERPVLVFGLPGNPVSGLVCFRLFVLPVLQRLMGGRERLGIDTVAGAIAAPYVHRGPRETFRPAVIESADGQGLPQVIPHPWQGSADAAGMAGANCLLRLPPSDLQLEAGDRVEVVPFD